MRIAIVGNAPFVQDCSAPIDDSDFVVRFNKCGNYGRGSGTKADALALVNTGGPGKELAQARTLAQIPCFASVRKIWLPRNHGLYEGRKRAYSWLHRKRRIANTDYAPRMIALMGTREVLMFDADVQIELDAALRQLGAQARTVPSTGMLVIAYVLKTMAQPGDAVVLYGFTHQGFVSHNWDCERQRIERWIAEGRLIRGDGA